MSTRVDIGALLAPFTGVFDRLEQVVTRERAVRHCFALSEMPAPSGAARFGRGRTLVRLLEEDGLLEGITVDLNYRKSGNVVLSTGVLAVKPVWIAAHLDQCSYLIDRREGARYRLVPNCYHMMRDGSVPALAITFGPTDEPSVLGEGWLRTEADGAEVFFEGQALPDALRRGARVIVDPRTASLPDGTITGSLDDAFGCAALALAAAAVAPYRPEALFAFTDEEEGPVGVGNLSFARGGSRLVNRVQPDELPELGIAVDAHESEDMIDGRGPSNVRPGDGACFGEASSRARGAITPPRLYAFQRDLAAFLEGHGVRLRENVDGYISRSDCVALMTATPNVALVGFLLAHRHFDGLPRAHPDDLVHLGRALAVYSLVAQSPEWRAACLHGSEGGLGQER